MNGLADTSLGAPTVRVLESLTTFTALGIRLWDPVGDEQVREGLLVQAHPPGRPQARVVAHAGRGGVYAFAHLPGLRGVEYGYEPRTPGSPGLQRDFVVQVRDLRERYLPVAFRVALPLAYRGVWLSSGATPFGPAPRGLHLYSTVQRPVPAAATAIRGELRRAHDRAPAAHALVRVETDTGDTWFGLADAAGRFAVILPYPALSHGFGGSPLGLANRALFDQSWPLSLSVHYEPAAQIALDAADVPDYLSVLEQGAARIHEQAPENGAPPVPSTALELRFDRRPTVSTAGLAHLLVEPSITSP